jgi:RNA polymerase sigma factor (sigma-70 family)
MTLSHAKHWNNSRLVEECVRGNQQAWHVLVDRYKGLVYSIPMKYGATPQDASDIFQAVWLDVFNELPRLRDAEALQGWLIRVTSHKCYHWKRQQHTATEWNEAALRGISDKEPIPPELVAILEREQHLREAMELLPARCKKMIELLFFEQPPLAYDEVARRLSLARGSIGFIRGRCLKRLKKILEEKGF